MGDGPDEIRVRVAAAAENLRDRHHCEHESWQYAESSVLYSTEAYMLKVSGPNSYVMCIDRELIYIDAKLLSH